MRILTGRERTLTVLSPSIEMEALRRAAEIRQQRDSDPDKLRIQMVIGARALRSAQKRNPRTRD